MHERVNLRHGPVDLSRASCARRVARGREHGQKEYELLISEIDGLEKEQKLIGKGFQRAVTDPSRLQSDRRRYGELLIELERKFARWEELAGRAGE